MELGEQEERYWHDFNDFQIQLRAHVDERDVLLRKVGKGFACPPSYLPLSVRLQEGWLERLTVSLASGSMPV